MPQHLCLSSRHATGGRLAGGAARRRVAWDCSRQSKTASSALTLRGASPSVSGRGRARRVSVTLTQNMLHICLNMFYCLFMLLSVCFVLFLYVLFLLARPGAAPRAGPSAEKIIARLSGYAAPTALPRSALSAPATRFRSRMSATAHSY